MDLFGTAGIRGDTRETVTPELALAVGRAVGVDARDRGVGPVVLGRDGRVTGPALSAAIRAGLESAGVDVDVLGRVPTPALAYASTGGLGVMLTASHNPPADNGIKLFADGVEFDGAAEERIERLVAADRAPIDWSAWGECRHTDVLDRYRRSVVDFAQNPDRSLAGLRAVLDCGNGMAALAAPQVLDALGADVTTLNANVDGRFPARPSKPTPTSLADLRAFVAAGPADVGFGFDGDADRIVVVGPDGTVVHEDTVLAVLAEHYVREANASAPVVVTTPNASSRIDDRVRAAGGDTTRVALGTIAEGAAAVRADGRAVAFAAEPWKHVHPGLGGWIDAVASAAVLGGLIGSTSGLDRLVAPVAERPYLKGEVACPDHHKAEAMARLRDLLPAEFPDATPAFDHGVRLDRPDGSWFLVRPSGTEPFLRLYVEGEEAERLFADVQAVVESVV